MMGAVHASIGAALGGLIKKPGLAFAAGILSHVVADAIPHHDMSVKTEVVLLAATLGTIAARYGMDSPQFWGAAGAVCPDCEHALLELGIIDFEDEIFPTHLDRGRYHGRETNERASQLMIFIAGILIAESTKRKQSK